MAYAEDSGHNPSSYEGQIESVGAFSTGLSHLRGWRREAARWFVLALFMLPLVGVVIAQLVH
jgi:hypothetical protein